MVCKRVRKILLNAKEVALWNQDSSEGQTLRKFKLTIALGTWLDCVTDVSIVRPSGQSLWDLIDRDEEIIITRVYRGVKQVTVYPRCITKSSIDLGAPIYF